MLCWTADSNSSRTLHFWPHLLKKLVLLWLAKMFPKTNNLTKWHIFIIICVLRILHFGPMGLQSWEGDTCSHQVVASWIKPTTSWGEATLLPHLNRRSQTLKVTPDWTCSVGTEDFMYVTLYAAVCGAQIRVAFAGLAAVKEKLASAREEILGRVCDRR